MTTPAPKTDSRRNKDLALIHLFKKQLGLDDETYRDMLKSLTGKTSAKDMDYKQRWCVLSEMGKQLNPGQKSGQLRPSARPSNHKPQGPFGNPSGKYPGHPGKLGQGRDALIGKIEALLTDAGRGWGYVIGIANRMFKGKKVAGDNVEVMLRSLDADQLWRLVASLEKDKKRHPENYASMRQGAPVPAESQSK